MNSIRSLLAYFRTMVSGRPSVMEYEDRVEAQIQDLRDLARAFDSEAELAMSKAALLEAKAEILYREADDADALADRLMEAIVAASDERVDRDFVETPYFDIAVKGTTP